MTDFLLWVEVLPISAFIRESPSIWGYAMWLCVHVMAMGVLAGGATVIAFALLGFWPTGAPIRPLERLFPYLWVAYGVMVVTGLGLFMADAVIRFVNWDYWLKMGFVDVGVWLTSRVRRRVFADPRVDAPPAREARRLAWGVLVSWFGAILCGRLIAYVGPVAGLF
jgi:hypothetical protein